MLRSDELEQIPFRYRLLVKILLKLPNLSLPFFVLKWVPEFEGILWALIVPCLLIVYFYLNLWLFPFLTLAVGFPLNYVFGSIIPAVIFLFFLRIELERSILWWRNIHETSKEWETSRRVEELIDLLKKQQNQKKPRNT